jgi:hypothetical protein
MQVLIVNHLNSGYGYHNRNTNINYSFDAFGNLFKSVSYKTTQPTTKTPYYKIIKQEPNESIKDYVIRIHNNLCYEMINNMEPQEISMLNPYCYILSPDIAMSYCNYKTFKLLINSGMKSDAKYYIERKSNYSKEEDIYDITRQICHSKLSIIQKAEYKKPQPQPQPQPIEPEPQAQPQAQPEYKEPENYFKRLYKKYFCPNKIEDSNEEISKPLLNVYQESFKFDF